MCADILIVGAGMAGVSAALWAQRLGLSCVVLEQAAQMGGQLHKIYNTIPDYPGVWCDGQGFLARLREQCQAFQIVPICNTTVERVWTETESRMWAKQTGQTEQTGQVEQEEMVEYRYVTCSEQRVMGTRALVVASGLQARRWQVPVAGRFIREGVFYTFSGQREAFVGKHACVLGGGDGAFENALMMAEVCPRVTILCRGQKPRARLHFQERVASHPRIDLRLGCNILSVRGQQQVEEIELQDREGFHTLPVEVILVKIGMEPQSQWLREICKQDREGYLCVDGEQRTSDAWIWAVGDVCTPRDPSLSVAAGQACVAIRSIERTLSLRENKK